MVSGTETMSSCGKKQPPLVPTVSSGLSGWRVKDELGETITAREWHRRTQMCTSLEQWPEFTPTISRTNHGHFHSNGNSLRDGESLRPRPPQASWCGAHRAESLCCVQRPNESRLFIHADHLAAQRKSPMVKTDHQVSLVSVSDC